MNLALDQVLRLLSTDPEFRQRASSDPAQAAAAAGITEADLAAAVSGDVVTLYERGAHPLLIMATAEAAGVDPMRPFLEARERELAAAPPTPGRPRSTHQDTGTDGTSP